MLQVEADGRLVTIFSAPNYCDQMGNEGAIIRIGKDLECKYRQFKAVPHPQVRVAPPPVASSLHALTIAAGSADGVCRRRRLHEFVPIAAVSSVALRIKKIKFETLAIFAAVHMLLLSACLLLTRALM